MGYQNQKKNTKTKKPVRAGLKQFLTLVTLAHSYPRRNSPKTSLKATQGYYFGVS